MGKSKIEWTDETWSVTTGCTRKSKGCDNCYAVSMTRRLGKHPNEKIRDKYSGLVNEGKNHFNGKIKLHPEELEKPLHWRKPRMVFVNSMSDLFHPDVPFDFVDQVFAVMALAKDHIFQVLTKRPDRMAEYLDRVESSGLDSVIDMRVFDAWRAVYGGEYGERIWPIPNLWVGTSVEDQAAADERIPHLLKCPAAVRFLSCEPLLGPIDLEHIHGEYCEINCLNGNHGVFRPLKGRSEDHIDWVIAGGESGHNARPMHQDWPRAIRDQCIEAGVPFFFKQWGKFVPGCTEQFPKWLDDKYTVLNPEWDLHKEVPIQFEGEDLPWIYFEALQKVEWRKLDGREWNQMPEVEHG